MLRPIDLAREHGLSTQAIRNYEDQGILPPAERSATGYRHYTTVHRLALRAFLALRAGYGYRASAAIARAAAEGDHELLFRLVDQVHAELLRERDTLRDVESALGALAAPPAGASTSSTTIGAVARRLGVHPATLRKWETAGILRPVRDRASGYRVYSPETVRHALIAVQLRRGGYLLEQIAQFIEQLSAAGGEAALENLLESWRIRVDARSRAMLAGAGELSRYLDALAAHPESR